jgi:ABC-type phosphate/phosphonate transport system substrate-binding protein
MGILLGAVAYDPKVVTIWDGFARFFAERGLAFDYILYTAYERQVAAHLAGDINVAWNSPLAWLQARAAAEARGREEHPLVMRDTDRDLTSVVVVRADSPARSLADLAGKRVGVGAADSPQATRIPLERFAAAGIAVEAIRHDVLVGKHGDHIGGERDAAKALMRGELDAACIIDSNHLLFGREGTFPAGSTRLLDHTDAYDHCNFTVLDAPTADHLRFAELLLGMSFNDPAVRPLMELEGLTAWVPGRTEGYAPLERACARTGLLRDFVAAR